MFNVKKYTVNKDLLCMAQCECVTVTFRLILMNSTYKDRYNNIKYRELMIYCVWCLLEIWIKQYLPYFLPP